MNGDALGVDLVTTDGGVDGLGAIVADLLSDNLEDGSRATLLLGGRWSARLAVHDADSVIVITVGDGRVEVGATGSMKPELAIRTDGDTLMEIPETPLWSGLPDPRRPAGRALLAKIRTGELRINGLLRHPLLLRRLLRLLSTT
jgi:hypothetical protein